MIYAVTGDQDVLRQRFLQKTIDDQKALGWQVVYVDGADPNGLKDALAYRDSFFGSDDDGDVTVTQTVIVVENPHKIDIEFLKNYKDENMVLLLHHDKVLDGRTKFGTFVKSLKKNHSEHKKPPFWEEITTAQGFCIEEAKRYQKTLSDGLALAIAKQVSTDLGFLSFEIQKMAMLADLDNSDIITKEHVKDGMAPIAKAVVNPLTEALEARSTVALIRSLDHIQKNTKGDATMQIAGLLYATVSKWFSIRDLLDQGVSNPDDGASRLGINPWFYHNKLLPQVQKWSRGDIVDLIKVLANAQRAVLNGGIDPWNVLVSGLVGVCAR